MWTNLYRLSTPLVAVARLASKSSADRLSRGGTSPTMSSPSLRVDGKRSKLARANPEADLSASAVVDGVVRRALETRGSSALKTGSASTARTFGARDRFASSRRTNAIVDADGKLTIS